MTTLRALPTMMSRARGMSLTNMNFVRRLLLERKAALNVHFEIT
jgi:hypothetical protein